MNPNGRNYGLSKACLSSLMLIHHREHPGLLVSAVTPGMIETDMTRKVLAGMGQTPESMGCKQPSDGAIAPCHCITGELRGNGWYWGSDGLRSPMDRYRGPGEPEYDGE